MRSNLLGNIMRKILYLTAILGLVSFSSCKKCYHCVKDTLQTSAIDSSTSYEFDICNDGKEGNGRNMQVALDAYQATGYACTKK